MFVNFYADWCRFSQILAPVFDEAAKKVKDMYPVCCSEILGLGFSDISERDSHRGSV